MILQNFQINFKNTDVYHLLVESYSYTIANAAI
jgi:hypothetical protein